MSKYCITENDEYYLKFIEIICIVVKQIPDCIVLNNLY